MAHKNEDNRSIVSRWGDPDLDDRYYVRLPGWMLFNLRWFVDVGWKNVPKVNQNADEGEPDYILEPSPKQGQIVGISSHERNLMATIMAFKFDSPNTLGAKPSVGLLAHIEGLTMRAIQTRKNNLVGKGALVLEFDYPRRETDTYVFAEVVRQCRLFNQFWTEHGLGNPLRYEAREKFIKSGEGEKFFRVFVDEKIFRVGAEKNFTQRLIMLKTEKGDETIKIVSSSELPPKVTIPQEDKDDNKGTEEASVPEQKEEASDTGKSSQVSSLPPKNGVRPGSPRSEKQVVSDDESPREKAARTRAELAEWIHAICSCIRRGDVFRGYHTTDEINHTKRHFGRELKAAGIMREAFADYKELHPHIDFSDLTPAAIIKDYYGDEKFQSGWLFTKKLTNADNITVGVNAMGVNFGEYLASPDSVVGRRITKVKRETPTNITPEQIDDPDFGTEEEFQEWYAKYQKRLGEKQKAKQETDGIS